MRDYSLNSNHGDLVGDVRLAGFTTTVESGDPASQPDGFTLLPNYPNPFNPSTAIRFQLQESGRVTLTVYNLAGRDVAELLDDHLPAGRHVANFEATGLVSETYLYRLQQGRKTQIRKMILVR